MAKTMIKGGRPAEQMQRRRNDPDVIEGTISFAPLPVLRAAPCESNKVCRAKISDGFRKVVRPVPPGTAADEVEAVAKRLDDRAKAAAVKDLLDRLEAFLKDKNFVCDGTNCGPTKTCFVSFEPEPEKVITQRTFWLIDAAGNFTRTKAYEVPKDAEIIARCACGEFA